MKRLTLLALALAASLPALADPATEALTKKLKETMPGLPLSSVTATPVPGVYEVVAGPDVVYMTGDGRYMFQGALVDFEKRKNLTEERRTGIRVELLKQVKDEDTIIYAPQGAAKYSITVFTDPSCPYCRKLHQEVPELNKQGVKVRYVLYPRAGLDSPIGKSSIGIMCAKDRKAELDKSLGGQSVNLPACDKHPLAQMIDLGGQLGLEGTPFIVTEGGQVIPGYRPAAELVKVLERLKAGG
ncbi:DsbC family protein [Thiofaba sp. EF100]|jgi:thiol:disulfide interchange protein DsbC|uniref:DsbC family protein n=1 Tax=Thiofaba sp. EF100 TaxID=3121274 RepID=UPI00322206C4